MEKIISIKEKEGYKKKESDWSAYDGYLIETTEQEIFFGISNGQACCENYGYFSTNDDPTDFVGASLISVSRTDTQLGTKKYDELEYTDCGGTMFVNLETSRGLLQFVAYNSHNGYYGHDAIIISKQLTDSESL